MTNKQPKQIIMIAATRDAYSTDQIRSTMTVGELIEILQQFEEDSPIYTRHDGGYTYGGLNKYRIWEADPTEEEE